MGYYNIKKLLFGIPSSSFFCDINEVLFKGGFDEVLFLQLSC